MLIPNEKLSLSDVPEPGATWSEIARFAATFNAWSEVGPEEAGAIFEAQRDGSISELRTRLFLYKRACTHTGEVPSLEEMATIHDILLKLRKLVAGGAVDPQGHRIKS